MELGVLKRRYQTFNYAPNHQYHKTPKFIKLASSPKDYFF